MNPDETVFRLALADVDSDVVDRLWAGGAHDPTLWRAGNRLGYRVEHLLAYHAAGVTSGADLTAHHNAGITPTAAQALFDAGHRTAGDQRRWRRTNNIGRGHRATLFRVGIIHQSDVDRIDETMGIDTFAHYLNIGVTRDDIDALWAAQIAPKDVNRLRSAGVHEITDMCLLGTDPNGRRPVPTATVYAYHRIGVVSAPDMRVLYDHAVGPNVVDSFRNDGYTIGDVVRLTCAGIDLIATRALRDDGLTVDEMLTRWASADDPFRALVERGGARVVTAYRREGVLRASDMVRLDTARITPVTVQDLTRRGITVDDIVAGADPTNPLNVAYILARHQHQ